MLYIKVIFKQKTEHSSTYLQEDVPPENHCGNKFNSTPWHKVWGLPYFFGFWSSKVHRTPHILKKVLIYHKRTELEVAWSYLCLANSYLHKGLLTIKIILLLKGLHIFCFWTLSHKTSFMSCRNVWKYHKCLLIVNARSCGIFVLPPSHLVRQSSPYRPYKVQDWAPLLVPLENFWLTDIAALCFS